MDGAEAPFLRGVEQFNRGEFFDAHETWEEIWLEATGSEKIFLQAIIQIAAAFHHEAGGNRRGALSLLRRGAGALARFPRRHRGIRVDRLREQLEGWAEALASGAEARTLAPPRIELESATHRRWEG